MSPCVWVRHRWNGKRFEMTDDEGLPDSPGLPAAALWLAPHDEGMRPADGSEDSFPPVAEMAFAELLEAVALNSEMAGSFNEQRSQPHDDDEYDRITVRAVQHFTRRNACMVELHRRAAGS